MFLYESLLLLLLLLPPINFIAFYIFVVEEIYFSSILLFFILFFLLHYLQWKCFIGWFLSYALCSTHKHIRNVKEFQKQNKTILFALIFVAVGDASMKSPKLISYLWKSNNNTKHKFKTKRHKKRSENFYGLFVVGFVEKVYF